ncbi:hypothetical protein EHQ52_05500 [Leptospira koniambonensis]|uniref:Uncharacterized protein n=1 Tax=Leptospira koniambonensis TaxID=2484950 RepID=A0A4R9J851_9LEPT|nr:DUF5683 domain-containing protein [Leptospira koniambonensis]TGL33984.1 hypothetical protein EHQ52_05500 [Leptospira koniambonensis]
MKNLFIIVTVIYISIHPKIEADTVYLKSEEKIENVKAKIGPEYLELSLENGKSVSLPKGAWKLLKIQPVLWTKKVPNALEELQERNRVEQLSEKGNIFTPRAEEDKISPTSNFFLGLIPGYSGLYRTENYWGAGTFTVLELAALANLVSLSSREGLHGGAFQGNTSATGSSQNAQDTIFGEAILGLLLLTDGVASSIMASSWNEGTYSGEPIRFSPKKTDWYSRAFRSLLFPGWGQIYAEESYKGITFLTLGVSLLAAGIYQDDQIRTERRDYQSDKSRVESRYLSGTLFANSYPYIPFRLDEPQFLYNIMKADHSKESLDDAKVERGRIWGALAAIWTVSLLDAIFFSGNKDKLSSGVRFNFRVQPNSQVYETRAMGMSASNTEYFAELKYNF